ncbi:tetratricopeptide repeat protein [Qipengyuania sp. CAU 1752]
MTFRPEIRWSIALAIGAAMALAACAERESQLPPMQRALAALEEGDGFGAELALREMMEAGTPREDVAAYLGASELLQGQPVEARQWLGDGAFSAETAGRGFHALGMLEMREGRLAEAGQAFDRALARIPQDARLWVDIGRLRYRGGEQTAALEAADKAVTYGPDNWEALMFRGQLARDANGMAQALPWFERAIAARPDQLELLAEYAATLGEAGEAEEMLVAVRRIAAIDPAYWRGFYLQSVLAARAGRYELARKLLARSGQTARSAPAGLLLSGIIDLETGNYASAAQQFDRLYRQRPENRRARDLLARALVMSGSHRELVYRLGDVATQSSASPYLQTLVARAHEALGEREDAGKLLDLAAHSRSERLVALQPTGPFDRRTIIDPQSGDDALSLVRSYLVDGEARNAVAAAETFRKRFPGSADALSLAADAQLVGGNITRALQYYERSAKVRQPWSLARRHAAALRVAGREGDARVLLEQYLAGHQSAVEPAADLARTYYHAGETARAALLLDAALLAGGDRDPELLALRSAMALRLDQPEKAHEFAARAFAIQPTHPASVEAMAMSSDGKLRDMLLAKLQKLGRAERLARR